MRPHFEINVFRITTIVVTLLTYCTLTALAQAPPTDADCTSAVPFADPASCTSYYQCFDVNSAWMIVHLDCPPGGMWDDVNKACVAGTCEVPTTTTEPTTIEPTTTTEPTTIEPTTTTEPTTIQPTTTEASVTTASSAAPSASTASSSPTATSTTPASSSSVSTSTPPPTTTPTTATTGPPTFVCKSTGFFAHPTDPAKYYQCVLIGAQFYYYIYSCPPSACFQQSAKTCVIGSCSTTTVPTTTTTGVTHPPVDIICDSAGQYPFPGSCTKYYSCILLSNGFVYYVFECPPGGYFNAASGLCTIGQCPSTSATTIATTTTPATTTTALIPTTAGPDHPCPREGYFVDPVDCQQYYRCIIINAQMYRYMFRCPPGAYWNSSLQGCIVGTCPTGGKNLS